MAAGDIIDFKFLGGKEMGILFQRLARNASSKAVRPAVRRSARRLKAKVLLKTEGTLFTQPTGNLSRALDAEKIRTKIWKRTGTVSVDWPLPSRSALGISGEAKGYYPLHVEFGHSKGLRGGVVPPKSYLRSTVNEERASENQKIGREIGKRMIKQAQREARKLGIARK